MRALALALLALLALHACDSGGGVSLPGCAAGLPVPDGVELVETSEEAGCVLTMASEGSLAQVQRAWRGALRDGGWKHSVVRPGKRSVVLRLEAPECGLVLLFPAGTPRVAEKVPSDRAPTLVRMLPCEELPKSVG